MPAAHSAEETARDAPDELRRAENAEQAAAREGGSGRSWLWGAICARDLEVSPAGCGTERVLAWSEEKEQGAAGCAWLRRVLMCPV
jgi:hypothetical protein